MRQVIHWFLFAMLVVALLLSPHTEQLVAQTGTDPEEEALETFVPSEKLPADSAISFPVDI